MTQHNTDGKDIPERKKFRKDEYVLIDNPFQIKNVFPAANISSTRELTLLARISAE